MNKVGLFLNFIGFVMLFWQSASRPQRNLEDGGGSGTTPADEEFLMQRALKWIKVESIRAFFAKNWQPVAFGLIVLGVLFQLISCSS